MAVLIIIGIVLLGVCIYGSLWLKRRAFYRRNEAGIEVFSTYGESLKIKAKEGLISLGCGICALAGIACFFVAGLILTK